MAKGASSSGSVEVSPSIAGTISGTTSAHSPRRGGRIPLGSPLAEDAVFGPGEGPAHTSHLRWDSARPVGHAGRLRSTRVCAGRSPDACQHRLGGSWIARRARVQHGADESGMRVEDVTDPVVKSELREGLDLGRVNATSGAARGIDARFRLVELLDIESNSVERCKERTRW